MNNQVMDIFETIFEEGIMIERLNGNGTDQERYSVDDAAQALLDHLLSLPELQVFDGPWDELSDAERARLGKTRIIRAALTRELGKE